MDGSKKLKMTENHTAKKTNIICKKFSGIFGCERFEHDVREKDEAPLL